MKRLISLNLMLFLVAFPALAQNENSTINQDESKQTVVATPFNAGIGTTIPMSASMPKNDFQQIDTARQQMVDTQGTHKRRFPNWAAKALYGAGVATGTGLLIYYANRGHSTKAPTLSTICTSSGCSTPVTITPAMNVNNGLP